MNADDLYARAAAFTAGAILAAAIILRPLFRLLREVSS